LNFSKLGAIADRYLINYYGETSSFLHQGGTDRLWVSWLLDKERVDSPKDLNEIKALIRVGQNGEPVVTTDRTDDRELVIEIPGETNAEVWREPTRAAFTSALAAGYIVNNFYVLERNDRKIGAYLLVRS
jgi:predicted GNAT superfamily acetyltransferase